MRIRLGLLLPLTLTLAVAAGLLLSAWLVGDAVEGALTTVPGLTRERAAAAAIRAVALAGLLSMSLAIVAGVLLARLIGGALRRLRELVITAGEGALGATDRAGSEADSEAGGGVLATAGASGATLVAEIQDARHAVARVVGELEHGYGAERRERAELAALVESVSEGIMQLDGGGRVVRVNEAGRHLLGLPADAIGRPVAAVVRLPELRTLLVDGAAGGGPGGAAGRKAGSEAGGAEVVVHERRLLVTVSPQDEGAVATFVDLTALRRLEEIRRDFVANASHELKTPLTSIRGYTETLLGGDLPPEDQKRFLATVSRNADRLQRIVDDLLDLSRLESGRWQPQVEPVDVLRLAERAWTGFADRAARQDVTFSVEADGEATALVDRGALEQVFTNLFDNALRHTTAGDRIRVDVTAGGWAAEGEPDQGVNTPALRPGRWLVIDVEDTGAGIPRDALPRIFERFYRVDPARSRAEGGTGLGLSIIRHIVETMGGTVSARSTLGKGTTIRVVVPAA